MILSDDRLKNVILLESARKEELSIYLFLKDYLFKDKIVYIGDSKIPQVVLNRASSNSFTDIFSEDKQVGLEVVTYETEKDYYLNKSFFGHLKSTRLDAYTIEYNSNINPKIKHTFLSALAQAQNMYIDNETKFHSQEIYNRINEKLKKLNNNKYCAFKSINLAIFTPFANKKISIKNISNIYKNLSKKYAKNFDNLYIFLNNKVYEINKSQKVKIINSWQSKNEFLK